MWEILVLTRHPGGKPRIHPPYLDMVAGAGSVMLEFSLSELLRLKITAFEFPRRMYCHSGCEADLESGHVLPSLAYSGNSSGCGSMYHTTDYMPIKLAQVYRPLLTWNMKASTHECYCQCSSSLPSYKNLCPAPAKTQYPPAASAPSPSSEEWQGNEGK